MAAKGGVLFYSALKRQCNRLLVIFSCAHCSLFWGDSYPLNFSITYLEVLTTLPYFILFFLLTHPCNSIRPLKRALPFHLLFLFMLLTFLIPKALLPSPFLARPCKQQSSRTLVSEAASQSSFTNGNHTTSCQHRLRGDMMNIHPDYYSITHTNAHNTNCVRVCVQTHTHIHISNCFCLHVLKDTYLCPHLPALVSCIHASSGGQCTTYKQVSTSQALQRSQNLKHHPQPLNGAMITLLE